MCVTEESEVLGTWCIYVGDGKYTVLSENMKGREKIGRPRFRWGQT